MIERMKEIAKSYRGECLSDLYINNRTRLKWKCEYGHIWETEPRVIVQGHWCPICRNDKRKLNINEMKMLAKKYNGECLSSEYIDAITKLKWRCEKGHIWEAVPSSVKRGHWCIVCAGKKKLSINDMRNLAQKYEGECLSRTYINALTKLRWRCKDGHIFEARPNDVQNGHWCPICSKKKKLSLKEIRKLAEINNGKCLSSEYKNNYTKLKWMCKEGHIFFMCSNNVQQGQWCPKCVYNKSEEICRKTLEVLFGAKFPKAKPKWLRNPETGFLLELDGYCEELGIAFEHNGRQHYEINEKFHVSESEFKKLKKRDVVKKNLCEQHGVKLIVIPQLKIKINGQSCVTKENLKQYILSQIADAGINININKEDVMGCVK